MRQSCDKYFVKYLKFTSSGESSIMTHSQFCNVCDFKLLNALIIFSNELKEGVNIENVGLVFSRDKLQTEMNVSFTSLLNSSIQLFVNSVKRIIRLEKFASNVETISSYFVWFVSKIINIG